MKQGPFAQLGSKEPQRGSPHLRTFRNLWPVVLTISKGGHAAHQRQRRSQTKTQNLSFSNRIKSVYHQIKLDLRTRPAQRIAPLPPRSRIVQSERSFFQGALHSGRLACCCCCYCCCRHSSTPKPGRIQGERNLISIIIIRNYVRVRSTAGTQLAIVLVARKETVGKRGKGRTAYIEEDGGAQTRNPPERCRLSERANVTTEAATILSCSSTPPPPPYVPRSRLATCMIQT